MKPIITVQGPVEASSCGMALSHEHMFIDLKNQAVPGVSSAKMTLADRPKLLCDPYCMIDNLSVDRYDLAVAEGKELVKDGCDLVVDCTLDAIGRDPEKLRRLAEDTGLKIVMGCGWYTGDTHPADVRKLSVKELSAQLIDEIRSGVRGTGIRPGVIGEIGTSKEILPGEWKALEAAGLAQLETGLALQVHIFPWSDNGLPVLEKLTGMGVRPDRIVICHTDIQPNRQYVRALLEAGVYVELDNFGKEFTPADGGFAAGAFAKDEERAAMAAWIIQEGFVYQLLLTNDICLKCMLSEYGGRGYTHLFRDIVLMIEKYGIPEKLLKEQVLHDNVIRMLSGC